MSQTKTHLALRGLLATLLILAACGDFGGSNSGDENIVNVYNWADYIAPDTIDKFEAEYGISVNYDMYDSSEIVDVKMLAGRSGYDVVFHSNQYSSRLTPIGVYEKLDYSRFQNMRHLDPEIMQLIDAFPDVRGYNIPYHWGNTGYAWNVELVRERLPDHPMDSGDVIFDPEVLSKLADCGVSLLDSPPDVIPMVLAYLGKDPNSSDDESLALAEAHLRLIRPYIRYYSNAKMLVDLPNKEICVAMSWSGDYATASRRAADAGIDIELQYTAPKEGSGMWVDGMYIPTDAPHKDNAYLFMDFMMRPDIAADIANTVNYANANRSSWQFISPEILNDPAIYPDQKTMDVMYPVTPLGPKRERVRTRAYVRAKSGI